MILATSAGVPVTDLECPCNWDLPEAPRDFNFEGTRDQLLQELDHDAREYGCRAYTILETFDDGRGGLWSIWRQ